jgi:hypothetical protein
VSARRRHQTLRATLDWSHHLLAEDERVIFRRLAVFAGGFTLPAAEKVTVGGEVQADRVLDLLTRLADKSLLRVDHAHGDARYDLLATVREYARECLAAAGEEVPTRRVHLADYVNENFAGSVQTQVTGLNNLGDTCGFWVSANNTNRGFVEWNGVFASYTDPKTPKVAGAVNQLLGINNSGIAVGFYNDAKGNAHACELNQATGVFTALNIPDAVSATATGINTYGDVVGFYTDSAGGTESFLITTSHQLVTYQFPGGSDTQALGINFKDQIVGSYLDSKGVMHGFVLSDPLGPVSHWQKIDDPDGIGSTVVNGINSAGDLVGFYTDSAGNTDGMLAVPTS